MTHLHATWTIDSTQSSEIAIPWLNWEFLPEQSRVNKLTLLSRYQGYSVRAGASSLSSIQDPWQPNHGEETTAHHVGRSRHKNRLLLSDLGWSQDTAAEVYQRLHHFEEDWNAPGMDAYDEL
jgi:hypothetical protein